VNGDGNALKNGCDSSPANLERFFPLKQRKRRGLRLQSELGEIKLVVDYGQDPRSGQWGCALARHWGLAPHQKITPGFADKLCFTATATGSYEEAAQVASRWTQRAVSRSTVHQLVQRLGALAEQQTQQRVSTVPMEASPQRAASHVPRLGQHGLNSFAQLRAANDAAPSAAEPRGAAEIRPVPETPRSPDAAPETPAAVAVTRAAATPQAAETAHAGQPPPSEVAPSRPIDQIAERFPALREFMAARLAGTAAPTGDVAEQAFAALADSPAPQATATVDSPAPAPDRRWAVSLVLVLCPLVALFAWRRARGRARDRAWLLMFDAALKASGSPPR